MRAPLNWLGRWLAHFLSRRNNVHGTGPTTSGERLFACLQPGDVLLVEGDSRISTAIKYLTQSTWSHAALFVGSHLADAGGNPDHCFVEADTVEGVRSIGIEEFEGLHTRICRPVGLSDAERRGITAFAIARCGNRYDLRNVFDLARYLFPTPPVPQGLRRQMLNLGSGDPTRAICSTLIAQAFEAIRYPILPIVDHRAAQSPECPGCVQEILRVRHHSLFVPRDFDVSPYFRVVKPTLDAGFDFRSLQWETRPSTLPDPVREAQDAPV